MGSEAVVLIILLGVAFVWLGLLSFLYYTAVRHYKKLVGGNKELDLEAVLEKVLRGMQTNSEDLEALREFSQKLSADGCFHLQKTGLVRFNPFDETGGDQSFAVALLDQNGDGIVISSLHTRELTRVYGKPVQGGKAGGYEFSGEEKQAVDSALGKS